MSNDDPLRRFLARLLGWSNTQAIAHGLRSINWPPPIKPTSSSAVMAIWCPSPTRYTDAQSVLTARS
jgi:hypothetical protein